MKSSHWLCVIALLIGSLWVYVLPTAAQEPTWQDPFEVSKPDTSIAGGISSNLYPSSWFPNIAIAPDGSVHVIWYSGIQPLDRTGSSIDLLMYRVFRGGRWSQANSIISTASGGYTVRNGIAMGRDGRLHVTLRSFTTIKYTSAPWQAAWSAQSWQEPYPVSNQANGAYYTSLAVDSRNRLHVVWSEAVLENPNGPVRQCTNCANLYYRSSIDDGRTWSPPINLSNSLDGDNRPQIVIDSRDRIHIAWDQGRDWYAGAGVPKYGVYRRSDDDGKTWTAPHNFSLPKRTPDTFDLDGKPNAHPDAPQQTTLAVRLDGNPVIVFRTVSGAVYFTTSSNGGTSWGSPRLISTIRARDTQGDYLDKYSMVTDGAGNLHLLMVGYNKAEIANITNLPAPSLLHLMWNGSSWSRPETVVSNELYPEYPSAVISGNTLHLVWYTRSAEDRFTSDHARYRVWYTSRQLSGAALAQIPLFTPVPVIEPTATVEPTLLPSPTSLPTAVLAAPVLDRPPAWESEAIPLMLLAILPTIIIIGLVIGVLLVARRRT